MTRPNKAKPHGAHGVKHYFINEEIFKPLFKNTYANFNRPIQRPQALRIVRRV